MALQLGKLLGIFRRQKIRDGGHELRHLHQRTLEGAERIAEELRLRLEIALRGDQPAGGDAGHRRSHSGADAGIARQLAGEARLLAPRHAEAAS
jgi:hypothetical protein